MSSPAGEGVIVAMMAVVETITWLLEVMDIKLKEVENDGVRMGAEVVETWSIVVMEVTVAVMVVDGVVEMKDDVEVVVEMTVRNQY